MNINEYRIIQEPYVTKATYHKKLYCDKNEEEEEEGMPMIMDIQPEYGIVGETMVIHVQMEGFPLVSRRTPVDMWEAIVEDEDTGHIYARVHVPSHHIMEGITAFQIGKFEYATKVVIYLQSKINGNAQTEPMRYSIIHKQQPETLEEDLVWEDEEEEDEEDEMMDVHEMMANMSRRKNKLVKQSTLTKINFEMEATLFEEKVVNSLNDMQQVAHTIEKPLLNREPNMHPQSKKFALLMNIAQYETMDTLKTPEFDGTLMAARLQDQGYSIETLHNKQVNKQSLMHALERLSHEISSNNDQLVLHFAGHGMPGHLCFSNYHPQNPASYLTLRELVYLLPPALKHILIILDCCHAGTTASQYLLQTHQEPPPPVVVQGANIHIVSSTMSDIALEDNYHGLFTAALCRSLRQAVSNPKTTFCSLFQSIADELVPFQQMPYLFQLCGQDPFWTQGYQIR